MDIVLLWLFLLFLGLGDCEIEVGWNGWERGRCGEGVFCESKIVWDSEFVGINKWIVIYVLFVFVFVF